MTNPPEIEEFPPRKPVSAKTLILTSRRLQPHKLLNSDYRFHFPTLEEALCHELESLKLRGG